MKNPVPAAVTAAILSAWVLSAGPGLAEQVSTSPEQTYTVQRGDTLWDITGKTLYDPFLWPRVWDRNRGIENPHLISPGFQIVIPGLPAPLPASGPVTAPAKPAPPPAAASAPPATVEAALPPSFPPAPAETGISGPAALQAERKPGLRFLPQAERQDLIAVLASSGFIIDQDEIGMGKVMELESGHRLLNLGDRARIRLSRGSPVAGGETYSLARHVRLVDHPRTGRRIGELVRVLGEVKVLRAAEGEALGEVTALFGPAEVGDDLIGRVDYLSWIPREGGNAPPSVKGAVLCGPEGAEILGRGDIVFIDLGTRDGVGPGDRLAVRDDRPRFMEPPRELSDPRVSEAIGEVLVVAPREKTSVARVVESRKEIHPGAEVVAAGP